MTDKPAPTEKTPGVPAPESLLAMDMQEAEIVFNELTRRRQIDVVLRTPWAKRQELILLASDSRGLVQALPEDEVYWMIKERGRSDSLAVISRTTHEQFQYLIDIDCWDKDRIETKDLIEWYRLLSKCNEAKVLEWFSQADDQLLIYSLKQFMQIYKFDHDADISEDYESMPSFTLDGSDYFRFSSDEARLIIMPLLNVVYQNDRERFYSLIEGVTWDSVLESEDEALEWRLKRIAEKGFPAIHGALSVYQHVTDEEIERMRQGAGKGHLQPEPAALRLRYGFEEGGIPTFLYQVLSALEQVDLVEHLQQQFVHLANKVVTADSLKIREIQDKQKALHKVLGYISIGLEHISSTDVGSGVGLLQETHPELLFRTGFSTIAALQQRIKQFDGRVWLQDRELFRTFYDQPWAETILGLIQPRPLLFEGCIQPGSAGYRDFECLDDIAAVERCIACAQAADTVLFRGLEIDSEYLLQDFVASTTLDGIEGLTASAVFLTALAQNMVNGVHELEALTGSDLQVFIDTAFTALPDGERHSLQNDLYQQACDWIAGLDTVAASGMTGMQLFIKHALSLLEDEFSHVIAKKSIDNRYISSLLLKKDV